MDSEQNINIQVNMNDTPSLPTLPPPQAPPPPSPTMNADKDVEQNDMNPSYHSLIGKIKEAKGKSNSNTEFGCKFAEILAGSLACTICLGLTFVVPIVMIVIGAKYLDDCPAERMIPIYLIVAGVFSFITLVVTISKNINDVFHLGEKDYYSCCTCIDSLIKLFNTIWFICGNVWVYSIQDDFVRSPKTSQNYCDPTLYYFAFWILTSGYIVLGIFILFGCICFCVCHSPK